MTVIECPICLDSFMKEDTIKPSECQHQVCFVCAAKHIYFSRIMKKTCICPICRSNVIYRLNEHKFITNDDLPDPIDNRNN